MKIKTAFLAVTLLAAFMAPTAWARKVLADLDFSEGQWTVAAVPLHNYKKVPEQVKYGAFLIQNPAVMQQMQTTWDLEPYFYDVCEHHYILKFYKDHELVKSVKVNLVCQYLTDGAFSYRFSPELFQQLLGSVTRVPWSRIRYSQLSTLRRASQRLTTSPKVFFYQEMRPYYVDGYFVIAVPGIGFSQPKDSVRMAVSEAFASATGSLRRYVEPYFEEVAADETITLRYKVYCDEVDYQRYIKTRATQGQRTGITVGWRAHGTHEPFLQILVVGIGEKDYWNIIRATGPEHEVEGVFESYEVPGTKDDSLGYQP